MSTVVIFAEPDDLHAKAVLRHIESTYNQKGIILDTAKYPSEWGISISLCNDHFSYSFQTKDETINSTDISGIWWRRPKLFTIDQEVTDQKIRSFCYGEAKAAFFGLLYCLGARVINPVAADTTASYKPYQLYQASQVGLSIPDTIVSNVQEDVKKFILTSPTPKIFKILTNTDWQFTETKLFEKGFLKHLQKIKYTPIIFQEQMIKRREIRATIIDNTIFAVECRTKHQSARIDWRLDLSVDYTPYELPEEITQKLLRLQKKLKLRFGAVDLCETIDGQFVFFELNTAGQFLFAEIHAGYPVAQAMAHALVNPPKY